MDQQSPEKPLPEPMSQRDPEWRNPFERRAGEPHPGEQPAAPSGYQPVAGQRPAPVRRMLRLPVHPPIVTYGLLGIIIVAFLLSGGYAPFGRDFNNPLFLGGEKVNSAIVAGEYWRLVTPIFLHAGLLHIFFNGYALYILGRDVESLFGHARYLFIFFAAGILGVIASFAFIAAPSVGASGGIFGLIGALGVYLYRNRDLLGTTGRAQLNGIVRLALLNLVISLAPGIDIWGHIGGLVGGAAVAWLSGPLFAPRNALDSSNVVMLEDTNTYEHWWWAFPLTAAALVLLTMAAMVVTPLS